MESIQKTYTLDNLEEFRQDVIDSLTAINEFVFTTDFHSVIEEMRALPVNEQRSFVKNVIINKEELKKRNIHVPDDLIIQRSVFGDNRPTLFCVTKYLKDRKRKVTTTFDADWA